MNRPSRPATRSRLGVEPLEAPRGPGHLLRHQRAGLRGVDSAQFAGTGTLRQAIADGNANPGTDMIAFDIGGSGAQTIQPTSGLPATTDLVPLDGTTQPGYPGPPSVLNGNGFGGPSGYGKLTTAGDSMVRGLVINGFTGSEISPFPRRSPIVRRVNGDSWNSDRCWPSRVRRPRPTPVTFSSRGGTPRIVSQTAHPPERVGLSVHSSCDLPHFLVEGASPHRAASCRPTV